MPASCTVLIRSPRTTAAPAIATTGMARVDSEARVSEVCSWAQFMRKWPPPGPTASRTTQPAVPHPDHSGAP